MIPTPVVSTSSDVVYHELLSQYEKDNTNYIMLWRLCKLWFPAYRKYSVLMCWSIDGVEEESSI